MNKQLLDITIVSLKSSETIKAKWLEVEVPGGSFVIFPEHFPIVSRIKPDGELSFKNENGSIGSIKVPGGMLFMEDDTCVTIIIWNN